MEYLSLYGKTVLITRPLEQVEALRLPLERFGATTLLQPVIEIIPLPDDDINRALFESNSKDPKESNETDNVSFVFDRLIFSSANGARIFIDYLERNRAEFSALNDLFQRIAAGETRLAAMGPGTARELENRKWHVDLIPDDFRAEGMLQALDSEGIDGRSFLSIRGSRGRSVLREQIELKGGLFRETAVYESRDLDKPDPNIYALLEQNGIDAITVTSSAIALSLVRLFGPLLNRSKLFTISSLTADALRKEGFKPAAVAASSDMESLAQTVADFFAT